MISQAQFPRQGLYAITPENILKDENSFEKIKAVILGGAKVIQLRLKDQNKNRTIHGEDYTNKKNVRIFSLWPLLSMTMSSSQSKLKPMEFILVNMTFPTPSLAEFWETIKLSEYHAIIITCNRCSTKGASYIALGSFYDSVTKKIAPRCGIDVLQETSKKIKVPIVAIGGLHENGLILIENGANFLACIDALFKDNNDELSERTQPPF